MTTFYTSINKNNWPGPSQVHVGGRKWKLVVCSSLVFRDIRGQYALYIQHIARRRRRHVDILFLWYDHTRSKLQSIQDCYYQLLPINNNPRYGSAWNMTDHY
jgi:hypothetical protein